MRLIFNVAICYLIIGAIFSIWMVMAEKEQLFGRLCFKKFEEYAAFIWPYGLCAYLKYLIKNKKI